MKRVSEYSANPHREKVDLICIESSEDEAVYITDSPPQSVTKTIEATSPTNKCRRLKQMDSSGSDDDAPAVKHTRDGEEIQDGKAAPDAGTKERASASEQKKTVASPEQKREPAAHASVAADPASMTNMEKMQAGDKKVRQEVKEQKAKALKKGELGGGWGGSVAPAKTDAADLGALSDEEDPFDDDDDEAKEELLTKASTFDASKEAKWKKGDPVPYSHLADMFEKVEAITKRLEVTAIVTKALRTVIETTPQDLLPCIYLCVNKLAPAHEGIELGLGDMLLQKALGEATGRLPKDIKADYQQLGDLGKVANQSRACQRVMFASKALTVSGVHKTMLLIASMAGKDSGTQKKDKIRGLLVSAKGVEAQYIVRQV